MTAATLVKGGYLVDNQVFPRVTSVCAVMNKPFIAIWRGRIGNAAADKIMTESGDFGTSFHQVAAAYLAGWPAIDAGALDVVRKASPFPAIPDEAGLKSYPVSVPMTFKGN